MHVRVSHFDSIGRSKISGSSFARYLLVFTEVRVQGCRPKHFSSGFNFFRLTAPAYTCVYALVQEISDRGCPYLHLGVEAGDGRVLLKFLTDLLYCDIILFSSIICSIGTRSLPITKCSAISTLRLSLMQSLQCDNRL